MKIIRVRILTVLLLLASASCFAGEERPIRSSTNRHFIETFPIMAAFKVYSVQYSYALSSRLDLVTGLAYVNVFIDNRHGDRIGRLHSPTIPVGLRAYAWRALHVEYQLWPAWNAYQDIEGERWYKGFDLYNEIRGGYRLDFSLVGVPLFTNLQYVYGFGLVPGNKPRNFMDAVEDAPPFHVPSASIGIRF